MESVDKNDSALSPEQTGGSGLALPAGLADIHCHVLPYVDDGAAVFDESLTLIDMQYEQGIRTICATPHLRKGMFETSDEEIKHQFDRLQKEEALRHPDLKLYLSREYHADDLFFDRMAKYRELPLGEGGTLLVEFSSRFDLNKMLDCMLLVMGRGYIPLIAHIERYPAAASPDAVKFLIDRGAMIQINAGSLLGEEGFWKARQVRKLVHARLVHVVASDAHDSVERPPRMKEAYDWISKKVSASYAEEVMHTNPLKILTGQTLLKD